MILTIWPLQTPTKWFDTQMAKSSDDIAGLKGEGPALRPPKAIGYQCVMWQVCIQPHILKMENSSDCVMWLLCMQSYIIKTVKSSDDIDHLIIPDSHKVMWHAPWHHWHDTNPAKWQPWWYCHLGPMCDVTSVHAVIYHGDGQWVMWEVCMQTIFDGIGVTRVHAVIYHGDVNEDPPPWDRPKAIRDQSVMWQVCMQPHILKMAESSDDITLMQSYIMEMTKNNDDIDHLTIPKMLAAANGELYDHAFCEEQFKGGGPGCMQSYHGDALLEHWGQMCDVTSVYAVIYHGDGEESPMCGACSHISWRRSLCDVTSVTACSHIS